MHIRKLELQGFKSFPNRTSFHFGRGVSGVVGPNGCGKSNVVDAVKWCLGEQSAKSLRGRSMDDIIFAGSDSRNAMGLAEVSITFEAGDEPFVGEFARCEEIEITRRLFRDGNSEYLINHHRCRLKDIQDIFRDTGASNRLYSFIEQGRIGEIVQAKPEQRRSLIEEAAGIARFKAKKREAELRLEGTSRNLERASDLVDDLSSRLRSLKRQVTKATRYRQLRTEVRQGEIFLGMARFSGLSGDRKAISDTLRAVSNTEEAKRRELERQDLEISSKREAVELFEGVVGTLRDELGELEATRREQESARLYQGRESGQLTERIDRLTLVRETAEAELRTNSEQRAQAQAQHDQVEASAASVRSRVELSSQAADEAEQALRARRQKIEATKATVLEHIRTLARDRANVESGRLRREDLEGRDADLRFRVQAAHDAMEDYAGELVEARAADAGARGELDQALAVSTAARCGLEGAQQGLKGARLGRREAESALVSAERSLAHTRGRLESIQSLQDAHEGVEEHAKQALSVQGVLGTLADHLDVDEALEPLVATALGNELECVLVPDSETALKVASATKGRVSMLLVGDTGTPEGALVAMGSDEVGRGALGRIMGAVQEVEDLETALKLHQEKGGAYIILEGPSALPVVVTPWGEIRIGPAKTNATVVLQRRRQLAQLQTEVPALEDRFALTQSSVEAASQAQEAAVVAQETAQIVFNKAAQRLGAAQVGQRGAQSDLDRILRGNVEREQRHEKLRAEQLALATKMDQLSAQAVDLSGAIEAAQRDQSAQEEALHSDQQAMVEEEVLSKDANQKAVVARTELAGIEQQVRGLARLVQSARTSEDSAARQVTASSRDIEAARMRITALASDDHRLVDALAEISEKQATKRSKIEEGKGQIAEARQLLKTAEDSIRGLRDAREGATTKRMELERQLAQVKVEIAQIRSQLDERYAVSVTGLLDRLDRNGQILVEVPPEARAVVQSELDGEETEDGVAIGGPANELEDLCIKPAMLENVEFIEGWVERLTEAKRHLEGMGEVNLVAVQEYAEVNGRYETLEAQRSDLDESVRTIRNTIGQLNRTCRERFRDTFERVNALFKVGYPKLVGGGQARLVLTDEDDMLETGVDIEVQPPGKRLQNLALLSGGEMAMAAIALIFALFQVKPSPFCLLDEVDAPLDEANGARFNNLLREMASLSQFIVITHNKKTMECVDTLYGVTMPSAGVSELVSVKLD
jgi:chromosome segregation protein